MATSASRNATSSSSNHSSLSSSSSYSRRINASNTNVPLTLTSPPAWVLRVATICLCAAHTAILAPCGPSPARDASVAADGLATRTARRLETPGAQAATPGSSNPRPSRLRLAPSPTHLRRSPSSRGRPTTRCTDPVAYRAQAGRCRGNPGVSEPPSSLRTRLDKRNTLRPLLPHQASEWLRHTDGALPHPSLGYAHSDRLAPQDALRDRGCSTSPLESPTIPQRATRATRPHSQPEAPFAHGWAPPPTPSPRFEATHRLGLRCTQFRPRPVRQCSCSPPWVRASSARLPWRSSLRASASPSLVAHAPFSCALLGLRCPQRAPSTAPLHPAPPTGDCPSAHSHPLPSPRTSSSATRELIPHDRCGSQRLLMPPKLLASLNTSHLWTYLSATSAIDPLVFRHPVSGSLGPWRWSCLPAALGAQQRGRWLTPRGQGSGTRRLLSTTPACAHHANTGAASDSAPPPAHFRPHHRPHPSRATREPNVHGRLIVSECCYCFSPQFSRSQVQPLVLTTRQVAHTSRTWYPTPQNKRRPHSTRKPQMPTMTALTSTPQARGRRHGCPRPAHQGPPSGRAPFYRHHGH